MRRTHDPFALPHLPRLAARPQRLLPLAEPAGVVGGVAGAVVRMREMEEEVKCLKQSRL